MATKPTATKDSPTTDVAVKAANALVDASTAELFAQNVGVGFENTNKDSFAIPFLVILQSLSPQVKKSDPAYIQGAEEGDFYDSVSNTVVAKGSDGVLVIPCAYSNTFVKWGLREAGGGYKGELNYQAGLQAMGASKRDDRGRMIVEPNVQINDTRNHAVLVKIGEFWHPFMMSLTSTQIPASKRWMTAMSNMRIRGANGAFTPPMFSSMWKLTTVAQKNEKGAWMGWMMEPQGYVEDAAVFQEALAFHKSVAAGTAQVASRDEAANAGGDGSAVPDGEEAF